MDKPDSNGLGISYLTALQQGLNPLGAQPIVTGSIASLPLQGQAEAVTLAGSTFTPAGQTAYVATGSYGLAIVDASRFEQPMVEGQITLPGNSVGVALDPTLNVAAVASGSTGLNLVNVSVSTMPSLLQTVALPFGAQLVQYYDGLFYVASGRMLVTIDPASGEVDQTLDRGGATLSGLTRDGIFFPLHPRYEQCASGHRHQQLPGGGPRFRFAAR